MHSLQTSMGSTYCTGIPGLHQDLFAAPRPLFFWSNAKSFPQRLDLLGPGGCRMSAISRFFMWNTWQLEWGRDGKYLLAKYGKFPDFDMVLRCFMKISPETQHGNAGLHQVFSDRSRLVRCLSASMSQVSRLGG